MKQRQQYRNVNSSQLKDNYFVSESNLQTEKPIGIGKEGYIMADKNPKHMLKKKQVKAKDKKKHIYE